MNDKNNSAAKDYQEINPDRNEVFADILSNSLRKGFRILQMLMFILALIFIFSNIYWVEEGFVAIHCRFGKITGDDNFVVKPGGPYFALPSPADKIIKIPTTMQSVEIDRAFWLEKPQKTKEAKDSSDLREYNNYLVPGVDGSLITGDKNLVQGQWSVDFQIDNDKMFSFMENTGSINNARQMVKDAVEQAIVKVVAQLPVDKFIRGSIDNNKIKQYAQNTLLKMKCGIKLNNIAQKRYTVPKLLFRSFQAVNRAESEKASQIESAKRYRAASLNCVAGKAHQAIINVIKKYEDAIAACNIQEIAVADQEISKTFRELAARGEVSQILDSARIYKTQTVEKVKGESRRFEKLLEQYSLNPVILKTRLLQDALQTIFSGDVKTFYLPRDEKKIIYLDIDKK